MIIKSTNVNQSIAKEMTKNDLSLMILSGLTRIKNKTFNQIFP